LKLGRAASFFLINHQHVPGYSPGMTWNDKSELWVAGLQNYDQSPVVTLESWFGAPDSPGLWCRSVQHW
jgi:hypothetical protein